MAGEVFYDPSPGGGESRGFESNVMGKSKIKNQKAKITEEEVKHVGKLANLSLTEAEVEKFQQQLSEVLDYVEVLNEVDTEGVEPASQVMGLENITRDDIAGSSLSQEEALSEAKNKEKGMFKTKAIFK